MTRLILSIYLSLSTLGCAVGAVISGKVTDHKGEPLPGVNIYLEGTYDGSTSDVAGFYSFHTSEKGTHTIIASFIGYKSAALEVNIDEDVIINHALKEEVNKLNAVVITAGAFEASDERKSVVLKPLDIATTAGATADIPGALNTLPGTTVNGETGRLFVRGGASHETKAFIDGALVHNFYSPTPNNIPSRSRFSPFLFKGTFFSTGGYSAEYGQAMSSVLSLNSVDIPDQTQSDISIMSVGGDVAHTQKWDNGSIYGQVQYTNLDPYMGIIPQNLTWDNGITSYNSTMMLRQKFGKSDMLKVYANLDKSGFAVRMPNINHLDTPDLIDVNNANFYVNSSYRTTFGKNTAGYVGFSIGNNEDDLDFNADNILTTYRGLHGKVYVTRDLATNISIKAGSEIITTQVKEDANLDIDGRIISKFSNANLAAFLEADYYINTQFTLRAGVRYSQYSLLDHTAISPRFSMAYKTGQHGQVSMGFGKFHQLPESNVLIRTTNLKPESADHLLVNYQRSYNGQTFRIEGYLKNYDRLVRFDANDTFNPGSYDNSGHGYARGVDIFWRDSRSIKNAEYWISYSFVDSKRNYRDYPVSANPTFTSRHNLSIVYKHFIKSIKSQLGATLAYNSGRPYNDPNRDEFNGNTTSHYLNFSFNCAYLMKQNIIFYASATNLLGRDNIFGYDYTDQPGRDGQYDRMAIRQGAKRFFFLGVFITLTKNKQANQLNNI